MRLRPGLIRVMCAATMALPTAPALGGAHVGAAVTTHDFKTPSGNIVCGYSSGSRRTDIWVACAIKSGLKPPPPRVHCTDGDPTDRFSGLGAAGRSHEQTCSGDPGVLVFEKQARVLRYGRSVRLGPRRHALHVSLRRTDVQRQGGPRRRPAAVSARGASS